MFATVVPISYQNVLSHFHGRAAFGLKAMTILSGEQLILMLRTIHEATHSNATAITASRTTVEGLHNQLLTAEKTWRVSHEELHARLH